MCWASTSRVWSSGFRREEATCTAVAALAGELGFVMMRSRRRAGRGFLVDVLISMDIEGVAGIATRQQIHPQGRDYPIARALMTRRPTLPSSGPSAGPR